MGKLRTLVAAAAIAATVAVIAAPGRALGQTPLLRRAGVPRPPSVLVPCPVAPPALTPGLYVSECSGNLWSVDPATGFATYIGILGDGTRTFSGFDIGLTTDGFLYGTTASELFCADASNAVAAGIGPHATTTTLNGLTGGPSGSLLGIDQGGVATGPSLYALDLTTGAAAVVGPLTGGCGASSGDLAYRPSDGALFAVLACLPNDTLVVLDPATGAVTATVGPILDAAGIPQSGVYGIGFDTCDRLYATSNTRLLQLDPATARSLVDVPITPDVPFPPFLQACGVAAFLDRGCCFASAPVPPPVCAGATVRLDGSASGGCGAAGGEYRWSEGARVVCDWSPSPVCDVQPTASATYTLELRCNAAPSCSAQQAVAVEVVEDPIAVLAAIPPVCVGGNALLDASGSTAVGCAQPLEYEFRDVAAGVLQPWSPLSSYGPFTATATATYEVAVRCPAPPACAATARRTLAVTPVPQAALAALAPVCAGAPVLLDASGSVPSGCPLPLEYEFRDVALGVLRPWSTAATHGPFPAAAAATYEVAVRCPAGAGCEATAQRTLAVTPVPVAALTAAARVCAGAPITLDASATQAAGCPLPLEYEFRDGAIVLRAFSPSPVHGPFAPAASTTYTVAARCPQAPGCSATASRAVEVRTCTLDVRFHSYAAQLVAGGADVLWSTTLESDTSGFLVERSARGPEGPFEQRGWVDARGAGADYAFPDRDDVAAAGAWYRIVELTSSGRGDATGPFRAAERTPGNGAGSRHRRRGLYQ